jgi:uncharacterized repeat protein (TIGR01451 family)
MGVNIIKLKDALKKRIAQKPFMFSLIAFMVGASIFAYGLTRAYGPTDCDSNAIIRCGVYESSTMINQYNSNTNGVKDIYTHFQINGDFSGMVDGTVTNTNQVIVGGQVVANDALTVGRTSIGTSEAISLGGRTFYKRQPSTSFASSSIPAYVKMVNGQFKWAVLKSCGNPVQGTPTTQEQTPNLSLKKYVQSVTNPKGYIDANTTSSQLTVNPGDTIIYKIDLRNSGNGAANNVTIADQVEATIGAGVDINTLRITQSNVPGARIEAVGGKKWIKTNAFTINPGESKYVEFSVRVKSSFSGAFDNIGCYAVAGMALPICDNAKVNVNKPATPPPTPTPVLDFKKYVGGVTTQSNLGYLDADKDKASQPKLHVKSGETITYKLDLRNTGTVRASNVTIADQVEATIGTAVDISTLRITASNTPNTRIEAVGGKKWIKTDSFTINPGESKYVEFSVRIKANFSGSLDNIGCYGIAGMTIPICNDAQVIVDPPVAVPVYRCTNLTYDKLLRTRFKFTVTGEARNGAIKTGYIIKVNGREVYNGTEDNYTYNQTTPGTYTVKAYVKTNKGTTTEVAACTKTITVDPPVAVPVYKCTNLTVDKQLRTRFKFTVTGEASNGATKTGYIIKVNGREVYSGKADNYIYNQTTPGTYTVKAYVVTNKGTTKEVAVCTKTITVSPAPEVPTYTIKKYVETEDAQDNANSVSVEPNEPFEYKVVVKNTSTRTTINSIKAWDVLPAGVEYVDNTLKLNGTAVANDSDYFDPAKGVVITNLAAGREAVFTFKAIIKAETDEQKAEMCANVNGGTFYNNVAKADPGAQGTGEGASDLPEKQDPAVINCSYVSHPNYTIKKYVNTRDAQDENSAVTIEPNVPFEYRVEVSNTGDVDLKNVKVWDVLPEGVDYINDTLKQDGNLLPWDDNFFNQSVGVTVTTLAKNQTVIFTFQAVIKAETDEQKAEMCANVNGGTFYNNVAKADPESAVGSMANDPNLGQKDDPAVIKCSFTPPVKHPSVIIEKEVSDYQVTIGGQFTWFITATNNGDVDLKNVVVSDEAPANTEFLRAAELAGTTIEMDSRNFKATISELKVGEKVTFAITAKLVNYQSSDITNTACVNAPEVNPTKPSEDDDCDDAKIKPVKEKCTVPGMENKDKDDPTCKPKCTVKGKEDLYADDKNCKDSNCIEVGGKIISTKGKEGCENPTAITAPSATPNTGMQALAASASTLGLSAAAFMATSRFQKRKK